MQTFLPYPLFSQSAACLDYRRLGKQRVEVKQIALALTGESEGWRNHPATKMWAGHVQALLRYGIAVCAEWRSRGYKDTLLDWFAERFDGSALAATVNEVETIHDHRFDLESVVLRGVVNHEEIQPREDENGDLRAFEVVNAKQAIERGERPDPVPVGPRLLLGTTHRYLFTEGERYSFPRGHFHRSNAAPGSITLITKRNEQKVRARLLAPIADPPRFGFDNNPWQMVHAATLASYLGAAFDSWGFR